VVQFDPVVTTETERLLVTEHKEIVTEGMPDITKGTLQDWQIPRGGPSLQLMDKKLRTQMSHVHFTSDRFAEKQGEMMVRIGMEDETDIHKNERWRKGNDDDDQVHAS
jgi:hypothetical protein